MPFEVSTTVELQNLMAKIVRDVIEQVSDQVLDDFKKDYIDKYVYGWGTPLWYKRTYEFRDEAWDWDAIKQSATEVTRMMYFDGNKMPTHTSDLYTAYKGSKIGQHGSEIPPYSQDAREYMASILDVDRNTSTLLKLGATKGSKDYVRPYRDKSYWEEFISDYVNGGKLKSLLDKTFASYGIKSG
jgi:hypothetical protein